MAITFRLNENRIALERGGPNEIQLSFGRKTRKHLYHSIK
jgi:hypothetical protein